MASTAARSDVYTSQATFDCRTCPASRVGLCQGNNSELLSTIASHRRLSAGQHLFRPGQSHDMVYNLMEGWVCLYTLSADGGRQILQFMLPGDMLGFDPVPSSASYGAQAIASAMVCAMPRANLASLARERPEIGRRLVWLAARDLGLGYVHLASVGRYTARERVARLLLELFVRCCEQWTDRRSGAVRLPLTQEHIADATGLSAVHVSRVLTELTREGILSFRRRQLRILDADRVRELAKLDAHTVRSWAHTVHSDQPAPRPRWRRSPPGNRFQH